MRTLSKTVLVAVAMAVVAQSASAFVLGGPFESWQVAALDYNPPIGFQDVGAVSTTKNLGEEWRLNSPIITYGYDFSFLDYFGTNGVKAVDAAFAVFNRLPAVSRTSADLSEFLTEGNTRANQSAQALNLIDLKSFTMNLIIEHMGLKGETHVFDLRGRFSTPLPCVFNYDVINRNFDPITWEPTHYVNGVLYTYEIIDGCPVIGVGEAIELPVDPAAMAPTTVASVETLLGGTGLGLSLAAGLYHLGLTRDDVGGLRYLYRRNNYNNEILPFDATPSAITSPWTPVGFGFTNAVQTNTLALRGGVEKITFVKVQNDSLLGAGSTFRPITYTYSIPVVTNFHIVNQTVRRRITRPDIIIAAQDLTFPPGYSIAARSMTFQTNGPTSAANIAGPGNIAPQTQFTFNKALPLLFNTSFLFLREETAQKSLVWGSFDGTTNTPVVYPQGASIRELEAQVLNPALVDTNITSGAYNPVF
jgi:hypothetical protein